MKFFARRLFLGATLAATALTLAACEENMGKGPVLHISGGYVEMGATPDRPAVGYFTVKGGDAPVELVAVSADLAQRIEMHESVRENGMMTMKSIDRAPVPARGTLEFKQGGKHLMIWNVNPAAANCRSSSCSPTTTASSSTCRSRMPRPRPQATARRWTMARWIMAAMMPARLKRPRSSRWFVPHVVIASGAKQSRAVTATLDCRVAPDQVRGSSQ
jgi:copper(I)-binding protein